MEKLAVIFDMDGVIAHTNPFHEKAFETFFNKHQIPFTQQDLIEHMYGKHNSYIMRYFFKRDFSKEEFSSLEQEKEALFREIYAEKVESIPHYLNFLEDLKQEGFLTGVATSAPKENMNLILDKLSIRYHMESLLSSEDVILHKPNPEVYLKSAENLGLPADRCLVFEDSSSGITAATSAGMRVVGVLSTHTTAELPPCDFYIHDYSEVNAKLVLSLLKNNI